MAELKTYSRAALIDMCGGTEEAVKSLFPHLTLGVDGLWLDRHAGDTLAVEIDESEARSASPDLDDLATRNLEARRAGWTWQPEKNSGAPALPIPFNVYRLAAFMLAGDGSNLFEKFDAETVLEERDLLPLPADADAGRRARRDRYVEELRKAAIDAPALFESALERLGDNADEAREALREAIPLRRMADEEFGRSDDGVRKSADWLLNDAHRELNPSGRRLAERLAREDARLKACEDAGLVMPTSAVGRLPDGVGDVATKLGITRQSLSDDVRAALKRRDAARAEGSPIHRIR